MRALPGDHIILAPPSVDGQLREGEVIETRGEDGAPPYVVRWSDGHEALLYPGPGAVLRIVSGHPDEAKDLVPSTPKPQSEQTPTGTHLHAKDWTVRISILGDDDDSEARVVLVADSPSHLTAHGHSRRSEDDSPVPEIGDEVAVARALRRLADRLLDTAAEDIEDRTGEHDVHLRAR